MMLSINGCCECCCGLVRFRLGLGFFQLDHEIGVLDSDEPKLRLVVELELRYLGFGG